MSKFADIVKKQKSLGKDNIESLSTAVGRMTLEKIDPRNYLFKKDGLMTTLFPFLKGYDASITSEAKKRPPSSEIPPVESVVAPKQEKNKQTFDVVTAKKISKIDTNTSVSAKNSSVLPKMAKDINVMQVGLLRISKEFVGNKNKNFNKKIKTKALESKTYDKKELMLPLIPDAIETKTKKVTPVKKTPGSEKEKTVFPKLSKDISGMRSDMRKMIKPEQKTKSKTSSDRRTEQLEFFKRTAEKEAAYEAEIARIKNSKIEPVRKEEEKKQTKGLFDRIGDIFSSLFATLIKGGLLLTMIVGLGALIKNLVTDKEFRQAFFSSIKSAAEAIFGKDVWENLAWGLGAVVAGIVAFKTIIGLATLAVTRFIAALSTGIFGSGVPGGPGGRGRGKGKGGRPGRGPRPRGRLGILLGAGAALGLGGLALASDAEAADELGTGMPPGTDFPGVSGMGEPNVQPSPSMSPIEFAAEGAMLGAGAYAGYAGMKYGSDKITEISQQRLRNPDGTFKKDSKLVKAAKKSELPKDIVKKFKSFAEKVVKKGLVGKFVSKVATKLGYIVAAKVGAVLVGLAAAPFTAAASLIISGLSAVLLVYDIYALWKLCEEFMKENDLEDDEAEQIKKDRGETERETKPSEKPQLTDANKPQSGINILPPPTGPISTEEFREKYAPKYEGSKIEPITSAEKSETVNGRMVNYQVDPKKLEERTQELLKKYPKNMRDDVGVIKNAREEAEIQLKEEAMKKNGGAQTATTKPTAVTTAPTAARTSGSAITQIPSTSGGVDDDFAKRTIIQHEGIRYEPYKDSTGLWHIGVGHLIGDGKTLPKEYQRRFSHEEVMTLFEQDYARHKAAAEQIPAYKKLDSNGRAALIDLTYNMGPSWWKSWPNLMQQLENGDMDGAVKTLRSSKWASQVQSSRVNTVTSLLKSSKLKDGKEQTDKVSSPGQKPSLTPTIADPEGVKAGPDVKDSSMTYKDAVKQGIESSMMNSPIGLGYTLGSKIWKKITGSDSKQKQQSKSKEPFSLAGLSYSDVFSGDVGQIEKNLGSLLSKMPIGKELGAAINAGSAEVANDKSQPPVVNIDNSNINNNTGRGQAPTQVVVASGTYDNEMAQLIVRRSADGAIGA